MAWRVLTKEGQKRRKRSNIIVSIVLIALLLAGFLLFHPLTVTHNLNMLTEKGYYNPVSVGDYSLNLLKFGNENGSHKIVALAGFGVGDSSVSMRKMTAELENDNQIVFLDRAGYGASDDTKADMHVGTIVEDYRTALKNANVEAPYTLMAHSIAGVYASYWVSKYPDEIDSVILLDTTWLLDENAEENVTSAVVSEYAKYFASKIGLVDLLMPSSVDGTKEEKKIAKALTSMTMDSRALISEAKFEPENIKDTLAVLSPNDIPKLYIQCGKELPDEARKNLERYTDRLGNCQIALLDSGHLMYLEKPDESGKIIRDFLDENTTLNP
ncbi:MAG: alpha/beta hydrolase [Oscillospiraceae bacterium]|nr:alpha/beta hydrolase [Oscillospiraceae bacterium]